MAEHKKSPGQAAYIGPKHGPINGAMENRVMARPRCLGGNISAITPPALVRGEDPKAPAKNRVTSKL